MDHHGVRFKTDKFDHTSDLPEHLNAGNRFYGGDLALFLCDGLQSPHWKMDLVDEDWGWSVFGVSDDGKHVDIAIYNLSDGGDPGQNGTNNWGLWMSAVEKRKWLGLLTRNFPVPCPTSLVKRLDDLLSENGIHQEPWTLPGVDA